VNTYTTANQAYPDVAMDAGGNFVVAWHSDGQDGVIWASMPSGTIVLETLLVRNSRSIPIRQRIRRIPLRLWMQTAIL
jgi:hypothetical protein